MGNKSFIGAAISAYDSIMVTTSGLGFQIWCYWERVVELKTKSLPSEKTVNYRARMLIPTVVEKNMTDLEFRSEARA